MLPMQQDATGIIEVRFEQPQWGSPHVDAGSAHIAELNGCLSLIGPRSWLTCEPMDNEHRAALLD